MFVHCKSCDSVFIMGADFKQPNMPVCIRGKCNLHTISEDEANKLAEEEIERQRNKSSRTGQTHR